MTPSDWATSGNPEPMLAFLGASQLASDRKLRLFAVACCRRISHLMVDPAARRAVELAEAYADAGPGEGEAALDAAYRAAAALNSWRRGRLNYPVFAARYATWAVPTADLPTFLHAATHAARDAAQAVSETGEPVGLEWAAQADLLHDIFGDHFSPITFRPEWRTEAVVSLARGIYEDGGWSRLGVLADALEDAGCSDETVLAHCRGGGSHVRGCHVVDAALGMT